MAAKPLHRVWQHPCGLPGVEARTIASERAFPRHSHDQLGVGVVLDGLHRSWSGVGHVEARAGDNIMVNPGEMHDGLPGARAPRTWRMLYFDPGVVGQALGEERFAAGEVVRPAVHDAPLALAFARLFARVTRAGIPALAVDEALVAVLGRALSRHGSVAPRAQQSAPVRVAKQRLDADPAAAVSLAELASLEGVSRFQLLRGFVRELGVTPHAYQLQRRVQLARRLIARGEPLAAAACKAGFADQSHLTRAFARHLGVTPGRYAAALKPGTTAV